MMKTKTLQSIALVLAVCTLLSCTIWDRVWINETGPQAPMDIISTMVPPVGGYTQPANQKTLTTDPPTSPPVTSFDMNQCDAVAVVNVVPTLDEDTFLPGSRSCFYNQTTTNSTDQTVMFFYHDVRSTQDAEWVSVVLAPWETHTYIGYLSDTESGGLTYAYIDRVSAMVYVEACQEAIDSLDTDTAAELFDYEPLSFCHP